MATQFNKNKQNLFNTFKNKVKKSDFDQFPKFKDDWDAFVQFKEPELAQSRFEKNKNNAENKHFHHRTGLGGYKHNLEK